MGMLPTLRWLSRNGYGVQQVMDRHNLGYAMHANGMMPLPLRVVGEVLRDLSQEEGPDLPLRIVSQASDAELAQVGTVAVGTQSPLEAVSRISMALPFFCSHELLTHNRTENGFLIRHSYGARLDDDVSHLLLLYAVGVLDRLCDIARAAQPRMKTVELFPHPETGLSHLDGWWPGTVVTPTPARATTILLPFSTAGKRFPNVGRDRVASLPLDGMAPLIGDGSYAGSVRTVMAEMFALDTPTIEDVAIASGTSVRSVQRRLSAEGTSFRKVLDSIRRESALVRLSQENDAIGSVAAEVGYTRQASLTRSMYRWVGKSPRSFRNIST
jgi:AraC-like DNA-binding protein